MEGERAEAERSALSPSVPTAGPGPGGWAGATSASYWLWWVKHPYFFSETFICCNSCLPPPTHRGDSPINLPLEGGLLLLDSCSHVLHPQSLCSHKAEPLEAWPTIAIIMFVYRDGVSLCVDFAVLELTL